MAAALAGLLDDPSIRDAYPLTAESWSRLDPEPAPLTETVTNADGRVDGPMLAGADLRPGVYRLVFDVERYFRAKGVALPTPAFLGQVPLDFGVADAQAHYHVPLLVSPWAYSTYRGS